MSDKTRLAEQALSRLSPNSLIAREMLLSYSGRFSDFNASVHLTKKTIEFRLSRRWMNVDDEIVIGLLQMLLARLLKLKKETMNMRLYHNFIRALSSVSRAGDTEKTLEESFNRVNDRYFMNVMDRPNIVFSSGRKTLGSYSYATDTIRISIILKDDVELLDYVMYHELLHRALKYTHKNARTYYHTKKFRDMEKRFENYAGIKSRLRKISRK